MNPVKPMEVLAGKYRVESVLGAGGMGIVVRATHLLLAQPVALKFLHEDALARPGFVARFAREARALARLRTEHVARVLDVGTLENGAPYLVMEYLEGDDLEAVLAKRAKLPLVEAATYLLQTCEAIAEAHAARIIHRDLKPANIFLAHRPDGVPVVKVLDFGIAKALDEGELLTQTATSLGSVHYMAPEQVRDAKSCDARADVWALGVILYQLVTGQLPFQGDTAMAVFFAVLDGKRRPVRDHLPATSLPSGALDALDALIDRCLEVDVAKRLASVDLVADALVTFVEHAPTREVARAQVAKIHRLLARPPHVADAPVALPVATVAADAFAATAASVRPPHDPAEARAEIERETRRRLDEGDSDGAAATALAGYGPEIHGFLVALHRDAAEAAEVFALFSERFWASLSLSDPPRAPLRTHAYAVAREASARFRREGGARARDLDQAVSQVIDQIYEDLPPTPRDDLEALRASLAPEERELLILRVDKKLSWEELADVLGDGASAAPSDPAARKRAIADLRERFRAVKEKLVAGAASLGLVGPNRS